MLRPDGVSSLRLELRLTGNYNYIMDSSFREEKRLYKKLLKRRRGNEAESPHAPIHQEAKPIQLVSLNEEGVFQIMPEAIDLLMSIKKPIVIVAVAGPYRSGKSFLLNLLTSGAGSGFEVGNSTHACTKGLWMWGEPKDFEDYVVIYLDSEGSRSIEKNQNHDAKLFSLLILVSSIFIYNSLGVIDERAIENLSLAAYLSDSLSCKEPVIRNPMSALEGKVDASNAELKKLASIAPKFVWVLRDFHLALVDRDNKSIKPNEYMEMILRRENCRSSNEDQLARTRKAILDLFKVRNCFVLPVPVDEDDKLSQLKRLPKLSLKPKFLTQFEKLETWLANNFSTKSILGLGVTGPTLTQILEHYVNAVNAKDVLNVTNSLMHIRETEYRNAAKSAKQKYIELRNVAADNLPKEELELVNSLHRAFELTLLELRNVQMRDPAREADIIEELEIFFKKDMKFVLESNVEASLAYNEALVSRLIQPMMDRMKTGEYAESFHKFQEDFKELGDTYMADAIGPTKDRGIIKSMRRTQRAVFKQLCKDLIEEYGYSIENAKGSLEDDKEKCSYASAEAEDIRTKHDELNRQVTNTQADELRVLLDSDAPELKELLQLVRDSVDKIK